MAVNAGGHDFNPRSPSGLRQQDGTKKHSQSLFQSTQPEWAATRMGNEKTKNENISIHAARVGCDLNLRFDNIYSFQNFNPRSPSGLRLKGGNNNGRN